MIAESVKLRKRKCSEKSGSEKPASKKSGPMKPVSEKPRYEKPESEKPGSEKLGFEIPISMVHEKTKPFSCPNCLRIFSDKRGFQPHLKKCSLSMATGEL